MSNDGGSAFPAMTIDQHDNGRFFITNKFTGMSLRQYYAGEAMKALIIRGYHSRKAVALDAIDQAQVLIDELSASESGEADTKTE